MNRQTKFYNINHILCKVIGRNCFTNFERKHMLLAAPHLLRSAANKQLRKHMNNGLMSSLMVFNRVYRLLKIQSFMLVFSTQLCELFCPSNLLSCSPSISLPPFQSKSTLYKDSVWLGGGGGC
jgi:hypothetical protein